MLSKKLKFNNFNTTAEIIAEIRELKRLEKETSLLNSEKTIAFTRKWHMINNIVP